MNNARAIAPRKGRGPVTWLGPYVLHPASLCVSLILTRER